jgi:D-serine deaminase-like pyridoxal phosphate-dependent protein
VPTLLADLVTPAPLVDLDRLAHNLDRMAAYAAMHGLTLRPHVKTHKSTRVAAEQLRLGAVGLTCATPRELEVMSDVSGDLLLAHPPVGAAKLTRVMALPKEVRLTVALDAAPVAAVLSTAADLAQRDVDVFVEVDLGMHRVGVQSAEDCVALARRIGKFPSLRFAGILFYPGHVRQPLGEQGPALTRLSSDLGRVLEALDDAGFPAPVVSGGSTPAGWRMHEVAGITEVRPGTYVYNDRMQALVGSCEWDDCALTVLATVVSTAVPGQAVVDAGSKALGREPLDLPGADPGAEGYGALLDRPEVRVIRMSEEHGILDLRDTDWRPELGDQVRIVPNHACIVVHLNDTIHGVRGEVVETSWPVSARGR